ncbi:MAG: hypothetical protein MRJ92_06935 [Nitrospira sp.]|nr:hypothetical protein [Nitrospira sp.]
MHDDVEACRVRLVRKCRRIGARGAQGVSVFMILVLVACAGPEPILKPTTYLQLHGKDQAEREAAVCGLKAERSGLDHGTNRSGNAGAGATLGLIGGAAVGASAGLIGGPTGIAIGAAAGARSARYWACWRAPISRSSRGRTMPPLSNGV